MVHLTDIIKELPEMKSGDELRKEFAVIPEYDNKVCEYGAATRLMALSDLYAIYVPSAMSEEIYSKLYLALIRSLQKKSTKVAIRQQNQNFRAIQGLEYGGIIGGSDSFSIIGCSGIGKSSAINRAISIITENKIIEVEETQSKIIPCLIVQCPFDCSVKSLLLEILRKVDELIGSKYYENAIRARSTTDLLIGNVSQVALNHIGLLIVDEIQNVCNSRNGKNLIGSLTQLINSSGISICMVGTPESAVFFESAMQLARRSLGLQYKAMEFDENFINVCKMLYSYQYTKNPSEITDSVIEWIYEHSSGIISVVVNLLHDAQEIAILSGKEELNLETLNEAYQKRLSLLHDYIEPTIQRRKQTTQKKKSTAALPEIQTESLDNRNLIADTVKKSKKENKDIVELLKEHIQIVEVRA